MKQTLTQGVIDPRDELTKGMPHPSRVLCGRVGILTSSVNPVSSVVKRLANLRHKYNFERQITSVVVHRLIRAGIEIEGAARLHGALH